MSHLIIVKGGRTRLDTINVPGDLSEFYDMLEGVANFGTNGYGRAEISRDELVRLVAGLPRGGSKGLHILTTSLIQVLSNNPETKKFIFHCS